MYVILVYCVYLVKEHNCLLHQSCPVIYDIFEACVQHLFYKASACDSYVFLRSVLCYSVYSSSDPYLSVSVLP